MIRFILWIMILNFELIGDAKKFKEFHSKVFHYQRIPKSKISVIRFILWIMILNFEFTGDAQKFKCKEAAEKM